MMCPQGKAAVAAELPEKKNYILNYYSNFDVKVSGTKLFLKSHLYTIPRTSVYMDGKFKFVNYKVGGTQNPYSFTETKYFRHA